MRPGLGLEVDLHDHHDIKHVRKQFMQHGHLIDLCSNSLFGGAVFQVRLRKPGILDFLPVLSSWSTPAVRPGVLKIEGGITLQFGNKMHATAPDHLKGIVIAKGSIKDDVGQWEFGTDTLKQAP